MKGLVLAGGTGSRLYPISAGVNKHLLPVYDKPMIYYPLAKLLLLGITDIAIICRQEDRASYEKVLYRLKKLGVSITFLIQDNPNGIPEAFIIAEEFIGGDDVVLILGDNVLYGNQLHSEIKSQISSSEGANIFGYRVSDPSSFGVVEVDENGAIISIEEKPKLPKSRYAIIGLYKFDKLVSHYSRSLMPSERGELEIVDLMRCYQEVSKLNVKILGRGNTWLDTGTPKNLLEASSFVQTIEDRQGYNIACLEEICLRMGYTTKEDVRTLLPSVPKNPYDQYVLDILNDF